MFQIQTQFDVLTFVRSPYPVWPPLGMKTGFSIVHSALMK